MGDEIRNSEGMAEPLDGEYVFDPAVELILRALIDGWTEFFDGDRHTAGRVVVWCIERVAAAADDADAGQPIDRAASWRALLCEFSSEFAAAFTRRHTQRST